MRMFPRMLSSDAINPIQGVATAAIQPRIQSRMIALRDSHAHNLRARVLRMRDMRELGAHEGCACVR